MSAPLAIVRRIGPGAIRKTYGIHPRGVADQIAQRVSEVHRSATVEVVPVKGASK